MNARLCEHARCGHNELRPHVQEQLVHVGVAGRLPLVLGHFIHLAVEVKVQTGQLLLHLPHVLHLIYGALVAWQRRSRRRLLSYFKHIYNLLYVSFFLVFCFC